MNRLPSRRPAGEHRDDHLRRPAVAQQAAIVAVTRDENIIDRFERIVRPRAGRLEDEGDPR